METVVDLTDSKDSDGKSVEHSLSDIDFKESLDGKPVGIVGSMILVLKDRSVRSALFLSFLLVSFAIVELIYSKWANSLALVASAFFDMVDAVVLLVGAWGKAVVRANKANFMHSYGFERFEVLVRFGSATYLVFVCLWVFFEGIERILEVEPTFIHGSYLIKVGLAGIVLQIFHTVAFKKYALSARNVLTVGSVYFALAWEFIADVLVGVTGLLIKTKGMFMLDTFVALVLITLITFQMIPVVKEMALILLQATPPGIPASKILREVSTIEGVLEVRKEHFWSTSSSTHVATLRVRVRREVDEAAVLRSIKDVCSPYVQHLTVQIEKDDWENVKIKVSH